MPDPLDLTGEIATAIDGAALRGATLALAYVRDDLSPAVSFRGSTHVHSTTELALWARKRDSGLAAAIAERPRVSLVYYGGPDGPGPMFLSIEGRARLAPEINDEVWAAIIDGERQQDPERNGVAVLIEVDTITGAGANGYFQQARAA
jgi:Pyridoxamine 5'-phosphate oxidase